MLYSHKEPRTMSYLTTPIKYRPEEKAYKETSPSLGFKKPKEGRG